MAMASKLFSSQTTFGWEGLEIQEMKEDETK